jgi:prepilin-type processing-associated H-X9-DG protein
MPFPFTCPHCNLETLVDDEYAGQSGPCAGCGKTVMIPFRMGLPVTVAGTIASPPRVKPSTIAVIVVLSILGASAVFTIFMVLISPSIQVARDAIAKTSCRSNLQRIAEALKQYEIEHGTLPPAFIPDAVTGKPLHSWRVLILPQLGEASLYEQYNFGEPWDGPNNSRLFNSMPSVFACPADPDAITKRETNYMVLVGPKTLFPGAKPATMGAITDAPETTILVTEAPVSGVVWTSPKDLNATRMQFTINNGTAGEMGSYHPGGINAVMVDGSVRFFEDNFPTDYIQGMSTQAGGEDIPWEILE